MGRPEAERAVRTALAPGTGTTRTPSLERLGDEEFPRVAHRGHSRVRDERRRFTRSQTLDNVAGSPFFVEGGQAHRFLLEAQRRQKVSGVTRVLTNDESHLRQCLGGAGGEVTEVADGGRDEKEGPGHGLFLSQAGTLRRA